MSKREGVRRAAGVQALDRAAARAISERHGDPEPIRGPHRLEAGPGPAPVGEADGPGLGELAGAWQAIRTLQASYAYGIKFAEEYEATAAAEPGGLAGHSLEIAEGLRADAAYILEGFPPLWRWVEHLQAIERAAGRPIPAGRPQPLEAEEAYQDTDHDRGNLPLRPTIH
jgi:hypothetical protein